MDQEVAETVTTSQSAPMTSKLEELLETEANDTLVDVKKKKVEKKIDSVLEYAYKAGFSLENFCKQFPDTAIRQAESALAQWLQVQASAAMEGGLHTSDGDLIAVNKNMTALIHDRVEYAQKELEQVKEYVFTSPYKGELKRDFLLRMLYNRAVKKGDTRSMLYMIDRLEGPPAAKPATDLDRDYAFAVYQIIHMLFGKQMDVLNSGNGTKLICCSRRAGKTELLVAICLIELLRKPRTVCIYIGETMELTEQLVDEKMQQIIDHCDLRDKKGKRLNWKKLDNGSELLVRGLSNTKDPDQIRGHAAKIIVIDEFFHLKSDLLEYLQREVLEPMQLDYADDYKFICAGTPPSIKGTFGEHAWKNWDVDKFFWTWRDNPHPVSLEDRKRYIEGKLAEKGLTWDSSYARREYNGEWAYDEDLLLYPEVHTYDPHGTMPDIHVDRVLFGIDYGVSDNDTLVGIAWSDSEKRGYVFHEDKFNRLDIKDRTVSQLEYLRGQIIYAWGLALDFFPSLDAKEANKRILWDADDNNQHLTDDFNVNIRLKDHPEIRLNIQNAHKTDKVMMFDKLRDTFRTGNLLVPAGGKVEHEIYSTVMRRGVNGEVYPEVDDTVYHPDLLPALRYAMYNVIG